MKLKRKRRSRIRNIITIISDVIFILILCILLQLCFTVHMGDVPGVFGYKALRTIGSSMEPLLEKGDCILIHSVEPSEVKIGDIISFFSSDPMLEKFVNTHRVTSIEKDVDGKYLYTTKGDNNKYEDYYQVKQENLLGVYCGHLPFENVINKLFELLSNQVIYFMLMVFPILLCLIESVLSLIGAIAGIVFDSATKEEP